MPRTDDTLKRLAGSDKSQEPLKKKRATRRQKAPEIDISNLESLSESELVAMAVLMGYEGASRQLPREDLVDLLMGLRMPPEDPIEEIREKIHTLISRNPNIIQASLVRCDLDCPNCPKGIVAACYTANRELVEK